MGEFSLTHILLVAIVFLIFFGPKKLPELGKSMGEAIRGFKKAVSGNESSDQQNAQLSRKDNSEALSNKENERDKAHRS